MRIAMRMIDNLGAANSFLLEINSGYNCIRLLPGRGLHWPLYFLLGAS